VYRIVTDAQTSEQISALPDEALEEFARVLAVLELVPWNGHPMHENNPDGPVRTMPLGRIGMIAYLILEDQQRVDLVKILWAG
jgi:hypothetical protein